MRQPVAIVVVAVVAVLVAGVAGVRAYDASRDDVIAKGVTVAGVDVGGLRPAEARARLERELAEPARRPIRVRAAGRTFRLSAERARVHVDVEGMVQEALRRSREGSIVTRTVRHLTGGRLDADVELAIVWSQRAVDRLVRRVARATNRPAKDATLSFSARGISKVPHQDGLAVQTKELAADINAELADPSADRIVRAKTKATKPKVTTDQLAQRYPDVIVVDRANFKLRHYEHLKLVKTYTIAVGKVGLETPAGLYRIQNKAVDPAWHVPNSDWAGDLAGKVIPGGRPDNPLKARWMGIYDGAGIHGTDAIHSLGTAASHGCIRMSIPDVKELYDRVEVGTPIYIA